ncbi:MAG: Hpt domain-containing protein [Desulfobacterales bacterium]|nr:Hpt domain-containing protein [Desulfobacterales bacterium]
MDFGEMASRLGIDREDFTELVELFITTTRSDMDKILGAMAGDNPADAAAAAHSIKGAAANLGFEDMADLAKTMEFRGKDGSLEGFGDYMADMEGHLTQVENQLTGA